MTSSDLDQLVLTSVRRYADAAALVAASLIRTAYGPELLRFAGYLSRM